ncbi:MAG: heme o synthase [Thermoanaerobaculia bacterium]|nr:heme o synthase [Thermoanaerobaculia bacterium]
MRAPGMAADLLDLTKPRINLMVVVTAAIGLLLGGGSSLSLELAVHALLGTSLVAAGGSALNHLLERETDALMRRTAGRPLPAGRLSPDLALLFGVGLASLGLLELAIFVNLLTALIGAAAFAGYVLVYTPLKRVTSLATLVGAVPGALPPVMGWTAARGDLEPGAWVLFGILFLWQLPHFLAIAWLCREDYARAGFPMLPVREPDGRSTARQALLYTLALVPVSLLPSALGLSGAPYFLGALVLGLVFLGFGVAFSARSSTGSARRLLLASVLYLPAVLVVMLVDRVL